MCKNEFHFFSTSEVQSFIFLFYFKNYRDRSLTGLQKAAAPGGELDPKVSEQPPAAPEPCRNWTTETEATVNNQTTIVSWIRDELSELRTTIRTGFEMIARAMKDNYDELSTQSSELPEAPDFRQTQPMSPSPTPSQYIWDDEGYIVGVREKKTQSGMDF